MVDFQRRLTLLTSRPASGHPAVSRAESRPSHLRLVTSDTSDDGDNIVAIGGKSLVPEIEAFLMSEAESVS